MKIWVYILESEKMCRLYCGIDLPWSRWGDSEGKPATSGNFEYIDQRGNERSIASRARPHFAGRYFPTGYGTLGGIKINHKTEVLTKDYEVIRGLYAVGTDTCGIYGDSYAFVLPGNTIGFAVNSGRIAGENVLEYIPMKKRGWSYEKAGISVFIRI
jgi:succinate dehydrogenase/fumarate reductase flavoprotein subunit